MAGLRFPRDGRSAGPIAQMKEMADHRWLWAHDVTLGKLTDEDLDGTKIIALSKWHKDHLQEQYPTADIFIAGNGIDPERFSEKHKRDPYKLIYASSPDRGLDVVLKGFPKIRSEHPQASLDVYYGFEMARQRQPRFIAEIEHRGAYRSSDLLRTINGVRVLGDNPSGRDSSWFSAA